ncbi:MAG: DUF255 domain-containing protein, partial [Nautiliaceae bacterium]
MKEIIIFLMGVFIVANQLSKSDSPYLLAHADNPVEKVYQLMNKRGGWPLTIIMTPERKPFYAATYIPPHFSQFGPGLKKILTVIAKDWRENSGKIKEIANNFEEYFKASEKRKFEEEIIENVL